MRRPGILTGGQSWLERGIRLDMSQDSSEHDICVLCGLGMRSEGSFNVIRGSENGHTAKTCLKIAVVVNVRMLVRVIVCIGQ
ncbi:hypothetical protein Bpfe_000159 [Biomphalaria pfeifferi]|uniref:Uncharacterized protein n=1 Tax=Biomphalaria pfeifferi TaxID=112525 RepID=A0AAD8FPB1_BIOPF|nr:hypothetical protein Bpfe_000159 [Biomphalaria pfeifferi]